MGLAHARPAPLSRRPAAFTLIELLVVIAIIALLIGLSSASLGHARHCAQQAICASNLHELGVASSNYLSDNAHVYWPYYADIHGGRKWWFGFEANGPGTGSNRPLDVGQSCLAPYLAAASSQVQCPSFPYGPGYFPKFAVHSASLGYNTKLGNQNCDQTHADSVFIFADGVFFDGNPVYSEGFYIINSNPATMSGFAHFRHDGKAQLVMADAHAETQTLGGPNHMNINGAPSGNLVPGPALDGSNAGIYGP